jgi:hypothetical protein
MTTKADYTAEEWELLTRGPFMAAMAVVAASPSGPIGVIKELSAVGKALQEASQSGETNALINALVSNVKAGYRPSGTVEPGQRPEEIKDLALKTCQEVAALLAHKAPAPEAEGLQALAPDGRAAGRRGGERRGLPGHRRRPDQRSRAGGACRAGWEARDPNVRRALRRTQRKLATGRSMR